MYLLCYHLDVNRLVLHGFSKVSLLETYNSIHLYDLIYVSETYRYFRCPPFNESLHCEITIRICPSCLLPANTNKLWIWEFVIMLRTNCGWYVYEYFVIQVQFWWFQLYINIVMGWNIYNKEGIKLELTSMNNSLRECF